MTRTKVDRGEGSGPKKRPGDECIGVRDGGRRLLQVTRRIDQSLGIETLVPCFELGFWPWLGPARRTALFISATLCLLLGLTRRFQG
jgi:hypothetical protein